MVQSARISCATTATVNSGETTAATASFKYKFGDEGYLLDYHGTKVCYPMYESLPVVERFQATAEDVCIASFPKSGSHFMGAVVWMVLHDGDPASLLEGGTLASKIPRLEWSLPGMATNMLPAYKLSQQAGQRVFLTHLGYDALPESVQTHAKIIYIARNAKDVIVSTNYFFRALKFKQFTGTMQETAQSFMNDTCAFGPFFDHVAGYQRQASDMASLFFVTYEEMLQDVEKTIKGIARFLGKELDETQIANIKRCCSREEMKNNKTTNCEDLHNAGLMDFKVSPFMRKGIVGDWKNHFSPELNRQVHEWIEQEGRRVQQDLKEFHFQYQDESIEQEERRVKHKQDQRKIQFQHDHVLAG
ncbi:sulfotransferase 1B1-like isoform X1 [Paramacrobiotus metropolitanus]|uniref:sulfotransferase 1B1-like isoform X1 n=2 Tax=Paramacrobiotus metropolitanus TaxID=2943436 RepID=UPI0024460536|nr:sulfotransferase 1B1-like isoform X1 [Paramacrobiotus metropolitanus]